MLGVAFDTYGQSCEANKTYCKGKLFFRQGSEHREIDSVVLLAQLLPEKIDSVVLLAQLLPEKSRK